jgi:hypothetical protein
LKITSGRKVQDNQLQELVCRLLQNNRPESDTPVIISTAEGDYCSSVGRLLKHEGACVSALVDNALGRELPVTVFLPENAYVGEVTSCVPKGDQFAIELILIQRRDNDA